MSNPTYNTSTLYQANYPNDGTNQTYSGEGYQLPDNFIYISTMDKDLQYWRIPTWPDTISDSLGSNFQATTALGRTAPVQTYSNSGPRTVTVTFDLHRDLMDNVNNAMLNNSMRDKDTGEIKKWEDQIDTLIRALQSIALPKYNLSNKMIEPPLVAVKIGKDLFIRGIVSGSIGTEYRKPIIQGERYVGVKISFTITEVDPYDSTSVFTNGSFRGVVSTFKKGALENLGIDLDKS